MALFTICSWDNTSPVNFDDYKTALDAASSRAATEGKLVKLLQNDIDEHHTVSPNGALGSWQHTEE